MRLTERGRTAWRLAVATMLTVAVLAWDHRSGRRPSPAGESTAAVAGRAGVDAPHETPAGRDSGANPPATSAPLAVPAGTGRFIVVPGRGPVYGTGRLRRYRVQVEVGLPVPPAAFAAAVERTVADPRGWGAGGRLAFQRVATGEVDFAVVLASPATTDRLCRPLGTGGTYSCFQHGRSVVNYLRWRDGAAAYAGQQETYRKYVVLHEVGHALGHGHAECPGPGRLAPTMMQQTKGVGACRPNPWPFPAAA